MKLTKITSALTALAVAAVLSTSAHAQTTYNEGDVLLGFEQSNGSGGFTANNYVVDLGAASQFINATGPLTFNINTTDLTNAFSSTWASNTGNLVAWGVIGGSDNFSNITIGGDTLKKNTLFLTSDGIAPTTASNANQNNINNSIQTFALDFAGQTESSANAAIIPSNDASGWTANTPGTAAFASSFAIEQSATDGPTDSTLSLYQLNNTSSTPGATAKDLGTFSLASNGTLTFDTPAAVPEPSSVALGTVAAALMTVLLVRKKKSQWVK